MAQPRPGVVSVVLVNFKGAEDTLVGIRALQDQDWPADQLEVIVVDNDSRDGSYERLTAAAPWVTVVDAGSNLGFAGGCNAGVAASSGEFVAFLNSDAKPDPQWISAAMAAFAESSKIGAVASRVLDWDGNTIDFVDAGLTWFGKGYKPFVGDTAGTLGLIAKDVLFGTGSAMFVRRSVFDALGGFDEKFFMFYEDVDFGWRLNLRGWSFRYEPASIAFHKHHGTVEKFGSFKEQYLLERNALFMLYKNLEQSTLNSALPASLALTIRRGVSEGKIDSDAFDFRRGEDDAGTEQTVPKVTLASVFAVDQFVERLPELDESRHSVQSTRTVTDRAIWSLFGRTDVIAEVNGPYREGYENIVTTFPVTDVPGLTHVLIVTGDPIGDKMAGPAIRAWNMAMALAVENAVILVTLADLQDRDAPFALRRIRAGDNRAFEPLERWADVIVFQGHAMAAFDALQHTEKIVVADIYDPMHLEQLEQGRDLPAATWDKQVADATRVLNEQMAKADFLLCASERQRLFYLGQLAALGRINPANYVGDPDLRSLLAVVPFGFDAQPPRHERTVLKGVLEGIGPDDKLLLWGGGLYNWFDPKTLIKATGILGETRSSVRLFFQGTKHPHPGVPEMEVVREARALAKELGLLDKSVFFNDSWVDYADRQNYLTEADAGVSTHFSHVETTFSFRTRILDYLWAELPMVVTEGDGFAELVANEGLGLVVPSGDAEALADALERILFDNELIETSRKNIKRVRDQFIWDNTLAPLVEFVRNPRSATDLAEKRTTAGLGQPVSARSGKRRKQYGLRHNFELALHHLRHGGVRVVAGKIMSRIRSR